MAKNKKKKNNVQKPTQNPAVEEQNVEGVENAEAPKVEVAQAENQPAKQEKPAKKQKADKKSGKAKPTAKERGQSKIKETVAELKKVTWPTFPKVIKNTLLVLGIVLLCTLILFGIDFGLSWLYKLLTQTA